MFPASCLRIQNSALSTASPSPASRLLKSAQSTVRSPFEPEQHTPLLNRNEDLIPSWITSQAHTSTPNSPDSPSPALLPSASAEGVDTNPSKHISTAPNSNEHTSPAHEMGAKMVARGEASGSDLLEDRTHEMGARESITVNERTGSRTCNSPSFTLSPEETKHSCDTLQHLRHAELTLSKHVATLDPLSSAFTIALQNLASLRYHIAAAIAQHAALQNPKFTKDLIKATAIIQRDHHRLAREAAAKERENSRRQREQAQDARYKQRQQDAELKYKRKLHLAELALQQEARADQRRKRAAEARDYREDYKTKFMEPNPHNQPKKKSKGPTSSLSHCVTSSLPTTAPTTQPAVCAS